jgi:hypothetical protein
MGEVILDATSNPWTDDFLSIHFVASPNDGRGYIATMLRNDQSPDEALSSIQVIEDHYYPSGFVHRVD